MATYTPEQFQKKLKRFAKKHPDILEVGLKRSTEIVRTEAVRKHLSGPKMPRGKGSNKNATLARGSGDLAGSVNTKVKVSKIRQVAQIISNMVYSRIHELGGKINHTNLFGRGIKATITMPKRPYLSPSLQVKRKEIVDTLLKAMIRGYKKA
jgi:phage gpG-like protein